MTKDSDEYGYIINELLGSRFERSLAANSLKLHFGTHKAGPQGTHYIWIDPPWEFYGPNGLIADSSYPGDDRFKEWSALFAPINESVLERWTVPDEGGAEFYFSDGYRLTLDAGYEARGDDDWYGHWYAAVRNT
ncbi:hypothetical protein [Acaryochloris marina]|uniref:hypothetical protein n=1 Tax=Acaryochloris marina TaxID=155978 RepID=UPI0005A28DBF|nr:hypothetical protein [Acaryochloris marina]BDM81404.1 hypothetical protein AM10699_42710 [Acaryochloris marina MBIC10699]